jgi:hypothetical protein
MAGLKVTAFAGVIPRLSKTLLKDNEAQTAVNTKLLSGELRAWNMPGSVIPKAPVAAGTKSIFRYSAPSGDPLWLSWATDVDVVPGPIYATDDSPIYLTGNGAPKKTNRALAQSGIFRPMGVPAPTTAPTVAASGGSGSATTRVYLYTFVTTFGSIEEEGPPSPASAAVNVLSGGTVTLSDLPATAPADDYGITKLRIYRSTTGTTTNPYLKVADVTLGTTSYVDNVLATGLGQRLESTLHTPPPDDLQGLTAMANGILAGFRENEIYFSEPFLPHAWPPQYSLTVEYNIIGLAAFGESLLVATSGNPFVISGSSPGVMSQIKLPLYEPCVSKRSMAADDSGGMYVSPNGVIKVSQGFAGNVSQTLFTRDEWQRYHPMTMVGEVLDGSYYLFYASPYDGKRGGLIFDRNDAASALTQTTLHTEAVYVEPTTASMFVVNNNEIKEWEGDANNFLPYEWKSKVFVTPRPVNFGAVQIEAEYGDIEVGAALSEEAEEVRQGNQQTFGTAEDLKGSLGRHALNEYEVNGSILATVPQNVDGRYVLLKAFCNDRLVATIPVTGRYAVRLPSGFKGDRWEFQLNGNVPLRWLKVAETAKELARL